MIKSSTLILLFISSTAVFGAMSENVGNGISMIDLGEGLHAAAILDHRENFNAHSFDLLSLHLTGTGAAKDKMEIIPFFDADKKERQFLTRAGGADCVLHDFRVLAPAPGKYAGIVTADRDPGDSFLEPAAVVFTFYRFVKNADEVPGWPLYYFEAERVQRTTAKYCDVGEAFRRELQVDEVPSP